MQGSIALSIARFLRNNGALTGLFHVAFGIVVPILFALLLVGVGWSLINRVLFDAVTAAGQGQYCIESPEADRHLIDSIGSSGSSAHDFQTDYMCWASGLMLKMGHRYRITLETPGNWFDRDIRADVAGLPTKTAIHALAIPLKRFWAEDWLKPIARVSAVGNDEYVLASTDWVEPHTYQSCREVHRDFTDSGKISAKTAEDLMKCAPTPNDRLSLVTEFTARKDGELFLYVNDAVIMLPGLSHIFYNNNSGTSKVTVQQIPKLAPP